MRYSKYLWVVGIIFIIVGFMGINQGRILSGVGFLPLALSAFAVYDKHNPKVQYAKARDVLFTLGLALAFVIWFFGPKFFPNL